MLKDETPYRILVIEDNEGDFALIEDYLQEKISAPVIFRARNFREGRQLIEERQGILQVILLDLSLPDKSREELIAEVASLTDAIPLIVLTGYSDTSFSVKSLAMGVSDYHLKDELSPSSLYKSILYSIERKRNSRELRESEKRYSELFHLSPQPMWVNDLDSLYFLNVNAAAVESYGYSVEEFLSMNVLDIVPPEDVERVLATASVSRNFSGLCRHGVFRHVKKNGEIIQVEVQSNMIGFRGKKARVVLSNDVTERINYINAIEIQNKKLREIAWTQSHLVRAPLTRMMGMMDLMRNFGHLDIDREELLDCLMSSARELDTIIRDISRKTEHIELRDAHEF